MVVKTPKRKNTLYIEVNVITNEPDAMAISLDFAKKPLDKLPTIKYVAFTKNERSVKIMPGAMVIIMSYALNLRAPMPRNKSFQYEKNT